MYDFKLFAELGWAVLVALVTSLAIELLSFHPEAVSDWRMWGVVLAGALARAVAAAVLAKLGTKT